MDELGNESGASMVEYGFLLAGIAVLVAVGATLLGTETAALYTSATGWF